jgi:hypothetical protein
VDAIAAQYGKGNGVDTDWLDLVTKQGTQQQYNLSATGGDTKINFIYQVAILIRKQT